MPHGACMCACVRERLLGPAILHSHLHDAVATQLGHKSLEKERFMAPVDDYITTNITLTKSQRRPGDSQRTNLKSEVSVCLRQLGVPPTMMSDGGSNTRISILNTTSNIRSRPGEIRPMATSSGVPPPKTLPAGHLPYIPWPLLPIVDCY
jgi:hypothetical protein